MDKNGASLDPKYDQLQLEIAGVIETVETGQLAEAIGFVAVEEIPDNIVLAEN